MFLLPAFWILSVLCVVLATFVFRSRYSRLPPGPKGIPLLGNIFDIPKSHDWLTYAKWSRQYGSDILHVNLVGAPVIILNSTKHAVELFEKRSSIYSDRRPSVMTHTLIGWGFNFALARYGDEWRERRRLFHQHFNIKAMLQYRPQIVRQVRAALNRFLDRPDAFMEHLRHMSGGLIISVAYGIEILPESDPYIEAAEGAIFGLAQCTNPGAYLVDYIPALQYVPAWFPGAGFKRQAAEWRKPTLIMAEAPFAAAKRALNDGTASPSVVVSLLEGLEDTKDNAKNEAAIRDVGGTTYTGGADTSVSALASFVLAMLLYPEAQRKAQEELDREVGQHRLPEYADEANLPYITAIVREVFRWKPVTPLAVPHRLEKDDEYMGYHLPKGAMVIGNAWARLHDESYYPHPDSFNPDRFLTKEGALDDSVPNPVETGAFGFGRRLCPGRHFASSSIWLAAASILATFDLVMATDEFGNTIRPSGESAPGSVSFPEPFQCVFKPRSAQAEALIRSGVHE